MIMQKECIIHRVYGKQKYIYLYNCIQILLILKTVFIHHTEGKSISEHCNMAVIHHTAAL